MNDLIKHKLALLPDQPGCYLMKDRQQQVIYVGKAKILRNRVKSYFTGSHNIKTQRLVSEIVDFEYIVVASELESLILEDNLIKQHNPKYNIRLKDDKTYPYLMITQERHPRLLITRQVKRKKGMYFGPYANVSAANRTKQLLERMYPLRRCHPIPKRACLYYHMHQCLGPCDHEVPIEHYQQQIDKISHFLKGHTKETVNELTHKMHIASEKLEFERAAELRDLIASVEIISEQQKITQQQKIDCDIFGYAYDKGWGCVQVFFIRQGKMLERDVSIFPLYQDVVEEFNTFIGQFYHQAQHLLPKQIYVPDMCDSQLLSQFLSTKVYVAKRGKNKQLVEMANDNAQRKLKEKFELIARDEARTINAVKELGDLLNIPAPVRIEAFDNSNIQGVDAVSAMVVFIDGKASKKDYRKYKIKTVQGADDYETMREVVRRRYLRALNEQQPLPDLIIADGGKGQISAIQDVLENELNLFIPVAGLVKNDKHQTAELLFGDNLTHVALDKRSQTFYLLQRIQDEVHRFAITFHRQTRQKNSLQSSLDHITGIGKQRKQLLLQHFGTIKAIRQATYEEILVLGLPKNIAQNIVNYYQQQEEKT